ncbi:MAG TPA: LamG domain-containing protein, partial [Bryobacteraceae bacterium]|nr:LamG domain-containing protein [Bryobacteraceae bacterium]
MLFSGVGAAQNSASTAGLVAYLPFDETSGGVVHDMSGNGNNGTLTCSGCTPLPAWTLGTRNGALSFSVPGDFVSVPDSLGLRLTNQFTFTFWAKIPASVTSIAYLEKVTGAVIGQGSAISNGYLIATGNPGNFIYINLYSNSKETAQCSTAAGAVQGQVWRHYAITYNGSAIVIYVNGAQNVQCNVNGVAGTDATPLSIGGINPINPTGILDEVRIYNRALSAGEIANVYSDPGLSNVSVVVSPGTQINLTGSQSQQFTASVLGTANTAVSWSIDPQLGSISNSGLYAAPPSFATPQSVTVTATSIADSTKSASARLSLALPPTLATFSLNELFGATWRDQPIEFRYDGYRPPAATTRMIGPAGVEVPYQWVSSCSDATAVKGCIAIRNNLPPNSNYTWTLQSGIPPVATPVNPVQLKQVGNNLEITNGLTGVRIVTAGANPSPFSLAPIQGIQLTDGSWTGAGASPNRLYAQSAGYSGNAGEPLNTPISSAKSYTVSVVDQGPLKTVVTVNYTFNRPQYLIPGVVVINNAGTGHYTMTVTLYANSKSVLFDED